MARSPAKWAIDGARVRALRMAKTMTIPELAAKAGIAPRTLSDTERGRRGARPDTIRCLAGALGVAADELAVKEAPAAPSAPAAVVATAPSPSRVDVPHIPRPKLASRTRLDALADLVRARGLTQAPVVLGKTRLDVLDPVAMQNLFARHAAFDRARFAVVGRVDRQRALTIAEARALGTTVGIGARYRVVVDVAPEETLDVTVHARDAKLAAALQARMGKPVRVEVCVCVVGKNDARVVSLFASARKRAWALVGVRLG